MRASRWIASAAVFGTGLLAPAFAQNAAPPQPNILVIFGDDIGQSNISAESDGLVGYRAPNIDRIAREGMKLTDYYAESSGTAGRSTLITGQTCPRTGLCKIGIPSASVGLQDRDVKIAQAWLGKNAYRIHYGVWPVAPLLETFRDDPPSQRPANFSIDQTVNALMKS